MAGTLSYRLQVEHVYQRRFDSTSLAEALGSSHWYIIARRPSVKIVTGSACVDDQILTVGFATRDNLASPPRIRTFGADFRQLGTLHDFQVHSDGAYFSVYADEQLIHGDAWALASLLSGASREIAMQEVLYVGQAFGHDGRGNAWARTQNHKKLQRIYEDHVDTGYEIFVAPLSCERVNLGSDDHIDDTEDGPDLDAFHRTFANPRGQILKPSVDLIEHSLISYFAPHYNEKLKEWRAAEPTGAMRKMRSAGFRLLNVHLRGWWGLARFYSAQEPDPLRSHFISQDLPPEPRRPVLRGIAAEQMSNWRFDAVLAREGKEIFANFAEQTGTTMRVFGDEAPAVRMPPEIMLASQMAGQHEQSRAQRDVTAHNAIRMAINAEREAERKAHEPLPYIGESSYNQSAGTISIGEYEDGAPSQLRLHDPETGIVDSTLILGDPRTGKSNFLRLVMDQARMSQRFFIIPSDPLDRDNFRTLWTPLCGERLVATDVEGTIQNLAEGRRIIEARRTAVDRVTRPPKLAIAERILRSRRKADDRYTKPSKKVPAILISIDNADTVLINSQGARLAENILSAGGEVGVGLMLVVSDISTLESNSVLMRHLVSCHNIVTFMPDGAFVAADLRARHGEPRTNTWRAEGPSFVVHRGPHGTTLGLVVDVTNPEASPSEAQSWASEQLAEHGITELLDWELVDNDHRSWWTIDPLKVQRWSLRRHHDAWTLILLITNNPVRRGPNALRWATEAIDNRYEVDFGPWRTGPTTGEEGLSAIYADVTGDIVVKDRSDTIKQILLYPY